MLNFLDWLELKKEGFINKAGEKVSYKTPPPPPGKKQKLLPSPAPKPSRMKSSEYDPESIKRQEKIFGSRSPFGN